jgi:hypothetical protein
MTNINIPFNTFQEYCNEKDYGWGITYCEELYNDRKYRDKDISIECTETNCPVIKK